MSNIIRTAYSDKELSHLLDKAPEDDSKLVEDFLIDQGDGTRACFNWELRDKGYTMVNQDDSYSNMSDAELLNDAMNQLDAYKTQKSNPQKNMYDVDKDFY